MVDPNNFYKGDIILEVDSPDENTAYGIFIKYGNDEGEKTQYLYAVWFSSEKKCLKFWERNSDREFLIGGHIYGVGYFYARDKVNKYVLVRRAEINNWRKVIEND